jgi:hypothetical protein
MHALRRLSAAFLLCLLTAALAGVAAPASAAEGYTYWGYYQRADDGWAFSQKGANEVTPDDGTVEGWRFATTVGTQPRPPRTDLTFDEVCAGSEAGDGEKRVAVVLDYGVAEDAPDGEEPPTPEAQCAVVPEDANGQQVLDSVADVRVEDGLTCGINGYPAGACATTVKDATAPESEEPVEFTVPTDGSDAEAAADSSQEQSGAPWALVGVGALVAVLVVAGVIVARRRA